MRVDVQLGVAAAPLITKSFSLIENLYFQTGLPKVIGCRQADRPGTYDDDVHDIRSGRCFIRHSVRSCQSDPRPPVSGRDEGIEHARRKKQVPVRLVNRQFAAQAIRLAEIRTPLSS
ncbi:MAG: hypothetical protein ACTHJ3_13160 [Pararhizobium sp.]